MPLLHRLGFSIVVHFHGSREFGKDLVFGEIDRFGHVRYHGLQAKYVDSIGINTVEDLIFDCRQAFVNPFRHPHTGAEERISTFYAVNGGSISDQAREHYFNSLGHPYGGNVRLIDGKGMLALDRWSAANRSQTLVPDLNGLLIELNYNRLLGNKLTQIFQDYIQVHGFGTNVSKPNPVPANRFRIYATARYLERPFFVEPIPAGEIEAYWEHVSLSNAAMDRLVGLTTVAHVDNVVEHVQQAIPKINAIAGILTTRIQSVLQSLGPITGM